MKKIIVSKCLLGCECRYDATSSRNNLVLQLQKYFNVIGICPEVEINLPTPRDTLRLENINGENQVIEKNANINYSSDFDSLFRGYSDLIKDVNIYIMKSKSPSCGFKDVKLYKNDQIVSKNNNGYFTDLILRDKSNIVIETDGRLNDFNHRELFLYKIFNYDLDSTSENLFYLNTLNVNYKRINLIIEFLIVSEKLSNYESEYILKLYKKLKENKISLNAFEILLKYIYDYNKLDVSNSIVNPIIPNEFVSFRDSGKKN